MSLTSESNSSITWAVVPELVVASSRALP